jgi:hypothetical protein
VKRNKMIYCNHRKSFFSAISRRLQVLMSVSNLIIHPYKVRRKAGPTKRANKSDEEIPSRYRSRPQIKHDSTATANTGLPDKPVGSRQMAIVIKFCASPVPRVESVKKGEVTK